MDARLAAPGPLDVPGTLARFHLWGEDPASRLADGVFRRAGRADGRLHGYQIVPARGPGFPWGGGPPPPRLADGVFRRAVRADGRWHGYELRWAGGPDDARLTVRVPVTRRARVMDAAVAEVWWICGLD